MEYIAPAVTLIYVIGGIQVWITMDYYGIFDLVSNPVTLRSVICGDIVKQYRLHNKLSQKYDQCLHMSHDI